MMIVLIVLVIIGALVGYFIPLDFMSRALDPLINASLAMLVLLIGMDLGRDGLDVRHIKKYGKSVIQIVIGVIAGSLLGGLVSGVLLGYSTGESLAISSGLGWYSLSGVMLSKVSERLGAMAFIANFTRELSAIMLAPVIARLLRPESTVAACGATAMDTALPMITRSTSKEWGMIAFFSGMILSALVPFSLNIIMLIYGIM